MNLKIKNLRDGISIVTINEPKTYNSLSFKNLKDLIKVFQKLDKDKNIKVIILEGAGKGFSAGYFFRLIPLPIVYMSLRRFPNISECFLLELDLHSRSGFPVIWPVTSTRHPVPVRFSCWPAFYPVPGIRSRSGFPAGRPVPSTRHPVPVRLSGWPAGAWYPAYNQDKSFRPKNRTK